MTRKILISFVSIVLVIGFIYFGESIINKSNGGINLDTVGGRFFTYSGVFLQICFFVGILFAGWKVFNVIHSKKALGNTQGVNPSQASTTSTIKGVIWSLILVILLMPFVLTLFF